MSSDSKRPFTAAALATTFGHAENLRLLFENGNLPAADFEKFPVATLITGREGDIRQVNNAFCQLFGYPAEELTGKHFTFLVHPDDRRRMKKSHDAFFKSEPESQAGWQAVSRNGSIKTVVSSAALFTDRKQENCKATIIQDVTSIKEPEQSSADPGMALPGMALIKSIEVLELAESMVMHDMRKPIANIIGICNLLQNKEYNPEELKKWLQIIKTEANKSFKLLDTKTGFKRMELNTFEPEISRFNILALIRNIMAPLKVKIIGQTLKVSLNLNKKPWSENDVLFVEADEIFLEIMFTNLITNAIEASPEKGQVKIDVATENNNNLKVIINNEGIVPAEVQKDFFEKYSTFGKTNGLGLGTYTAKLIAKAHKGDISFSTSYAEGTSLFVFLPGIVDADYRETTES